MPKRSIRQRLLLERRQCADADCRRWSLEVQERFLGAELYRRAGCIGLYSPLHNEVRTDLVAQRARLDGKRLVYPRVCGELLEFCPVDEVSELLPGAFGIREPATPPVPLTAIDLLVLPGLAFDLTGHRLGFGKGYYDRTLADAPPRLTRVGFAYEFQVVEQLPAAPHDCRITCLVTEQRTLHFPAQSGGGVH